MKIDIKRKNIMLNIIIIALCTSAVVMFCRVVFFNMDSISSGIGSLLTSKTPSTGTVFIGDSSLLAISDPLYTLVTPDSNSHYAAKYENDKKDELTKMFAAVFGEALGSASSPEQMSESDWQTALQSTGVFFDYVFPQSLAYLSKGLGTLCSNSLKNVIARRFILSIDGDNLYLWYINDEGGFYRCNTASSVSSLSSKISECPIGIAQFAFELDDKYENLDPYFIFTNKNFDVADISAKNPVTSTLADKSFLAYFSINDYTSSNYTETDGSTIYVEGDKSLRFDSDGFLTYSASCGDSIAIIKSSSTPTLEEVLSTCGTITQNIFSRFGVDTTIGVTDISVNSESSDFTVSFGQFINGIPVTINGNADMATYQIIDGSIVYIDIILRKYTVSKLNRTVPLPEIQTAAIANKTSGAPVLRYVDDDNITAVSWKTFS